MQPDVLQTRLRDDYPKMLPNRAVRDRRRDTVCEYPLADPTDRSNCTDECLTSHGKRRQPCGFRVGVTKARPECDEIEFTVELEGAITRIATTSAPPPRPPFYA